MRWMETSEDEPETSEDEVRWMQWRRSAETSEDEPETSD